MNAGIVLDFIPIYNTLALVLNRENNDSQDLTTLVFTSLAHFANDGNFLLYSLLIVYYYAALNLNEAFVGIGAIGANLLSGILTGPIGLYAQRSGRIGEMIALGIFLEGISALMFAVPFFIPGLTYWFIFVSAGVLGLGQAFYHPLGASLINQTYGSKRSPGYLGINGSLGSIGRAIFPLIIGTTVLFFSYGRGILTTGIIMLAFSLVIYSGLRGFSPGNNPVKVEKSHRKTGKPDMKPYAFFVYYFTASMFLRSVFYLGVNTYLADYLQIFTDSKFVTSIVLTIAFIPPIIGQPIFGKMVSERGGRFIVLLTGYMSVFGFALFMLSANIVLLTASLGFFAFFAFTGFPVMLGYMGQKIPRDILPFTNGIVWGVGNTLGSSAGVGIMVVLLSHWNLSFSFWVMLAIGSVSVLMLQFEPKRNREMAEMAS